MFSTLLSTFSSLFPQSSGSAPVSNHSNIFSNDVCDVILDTNDTKFDPKSFKHFASSIIFEYEPESGVRSSTSDDHSLFSLLHYAGQIQDLFEAYTYLDTVVDQYSGENLQAKTAANLVELIRTLHCKISPTLMLDTGGTPGEYSSEDVAIWSHGQKLPGKLVPSCLGYQKAYSLNEISREYNVPLAQLESFCKILKKYHKSQYVQLSDTAKKSLSNSSTPGTIAYESALMMLKLQAAAKQNLLSDTEKELVRIFVMFPNVAEETPEKMHLFAEELLLKWKNCDGDKDKVAEIAIEAWDEFIKLHPFSNANGRTGNALMNLILTTFGHKTFSVRKYSESLNSNSKYQQAVLESAHNEAAYRCLARERFDEQYSSNQELNSAISTLGKYLSFECNMLMKLRHVLLKLVNCNEQSNIQPVSNFYKQFFGQPTYEYLHAAAPSPKNTPQQLIYKNSAELSKIRSQRLLMIIAGIKNLTKESEQSSEDVVIPRV